MMAAISGTLSGTRQCEMVLNKQALNEFNAVVCLFLPLMGVIFCRTKLSEHFRAGCGAIADKQT